MFNTRVFDTGYFHSHFLIQQIKIVQVQSYGLGVTYIGPKRGGRNSIGLNLDLTQDSYENTRVLRHHY